jgi:hypothetical protein
MPDECLDDDDPAAVDDEDRELDVEASTSSSKLMGIVPLLDVPHMYTLCGLTCSVDGSGRDFSCVADAAVAAAEEEAPRR